IRERETSSPPLGEPLGERQGSAGLSCAVRRCPLLKRVPPMRTQRLTSLGLCLLLSWLNSSRVAVAQKAEPPWFRDATKEYGPIGGGPPVLADLDGDGWPDLICDGKLYKNDGGRRFIDVTREAAVAGSGAAVVADI